MPLGKGGGEEPQGPRVIIQHVGASSKARNQDRLAVFLTLIMAPMIHWSHRSLESGYPILETLKMLKKNRPFEFYFSSS